MPTVVGKSLKVIVVLDPASLLTVAVPEGQPRIALSIRLPDRTVTADLNSKSVRKAIADIREYGAEGCTSIIQGKLGAGDLILEAGLVTQEKKKAAEVAGRDGRSGARRPDRPDAPLGRRTGLALIRRLAGV